MNARFAHRLLAAFAAIFALSLASLSPAQAVTPAETYIQSNVQQGLTILNNKALSQDQMRAQFRTFLEGLIDIKRVALFTLGSAVHTAPPGDVNAFVDAFRNYAVAVYEVRLTSYSGQTLKVSGSVERAPGDFIVNTVLVDPNPKPGQDPLKVDFRVSNTGGKMVVIDASVAGVWLSIEEREQFTAFLAQHNNDVPALVTHLNLLTAELKKSETTK
jgi:phospholipid transport system substrate-binding protein